jgi:hypothetical protein
MLRALGGVFGIVALVSVFTRPGAYHSPLLRHMAGGRRHEHDQ